MKRAITLLLLFVSSVIILSAQELTTQYGKVTKDEVTMTTYQKDTTASAVTLYKNVDARYVYNVDDFGIDYYYETKIKGLKSEGKEYGTVVIPFYDNEKSGAKKELVSRIEAYAYNMENGKIIKTKMDKSYIFKERITPYYKQIKFSILAVKEGTVIENKYLLTSEFPPQIEECVFQQDIPVIYSNYEKRKI